MSSDFSTPSQTPFIRLLDTALDQFVDDLAARVADTEFSDIRVLTAACSATSIPRARG